VCVSLVKPLERLTWAIANLGKPGGGPPRRRGRGANQYAVAPLPPPTAEERNAVMHEVGEAIQEVRPAISTSYQSLHSLYCYRSHWLCKYFAAADELLQALTEGFNGSTLRRITQAIVSLSDGGRDIDVHISSSSDVSVRAHVHVPTAVPAAVTVAAFVAVVKAVLMMRRALLRLPSRSTCPSSAKR
jgi:hypothetical protein